MEDMITVEHVTKTYGGTAALSDVSFTAKPGRVTGFLGPNGAGKSTAMRIICGLAKPDAGRTLINGQPLNTVNNPAAVVGALLDAGAQHDGRTGREALTLSAIAMGVPRSRVAEIIDVVGLSSKEASRRIGAYSLGMRQRLGIANALLGDPQILILDEPVNGLDPSGIRWMRDLLRGFAQNGGTVLLSSHLLLEIEAIADDLVVIGGGRVVAQGAKETLLSGGETQVRAVDMNRMGGVLAGAGYTAHPTSDGKIATNATTLQVGELALTNSIVLTELSASANGGLEDLFFTLTNATAREQSQPSASKPAPNAPAPFAPNQNGGQR